MKSWHKGWRRRWCKLTVTEKVVSRKISYNVMISHIICLFLLFRRYCLSRFNLIWYVLPTSVVQNNADTRPDDEIPKECLNSLKAKGPWMKIQQFWRQVHSTFIGLIFWNGWHCLEYVEYYRALIPAAQVAPAHVNVVLLLQTDWLDIRSPELIGQKTSYSHVARKGIANCLLGRPGALVTCDEGNCPEAREHSDSTRETT